MPHDRKDRTDETPNRLTPDERYQRDPAFQRLVDTLHEQIRQCLYTPTELREAVILAAIHHEYLAVRSRQRSDAPDPRRV